MKRSRPGASQATRPESLFVGGGMGGPRVKRKMVSKLVITAGVLGLALLAGCGSESSSSNSGNSNPVAALSTQYLGSSKAGEPVQVEIGQTGPDRVSGKLIRPGSETSLNGFFDSQSRFFAAESSNGSAVLGFLSSPLGSFFHLSNRVASIGHVSSFAVSPPPGPKKILIDNIDLSFLRTGEQPAVLANLNLADAIANQNLAQQNEINNQQAMNQVTLATVAKGVEVITSVNPSKPAQGQVLEVSESLIRNARVDSQVLLTEFPGSGPPVHSVWYTSSTSQVTLTPTPNSSSFDYVIDGMEPVNWPQNHASGRIRLQARVSLVDN